jgi:predicted xylose isomerase-like sugar epimerase
MVYTNKLLISLTDDYGFEFGKKYKVVSDNGRELEFENGQRFFKDTIHLHFGKGYPELFAKIKYLIDRKQIENHKLCIENIRLDNRIIDNKKKFAENDKYINRLTKLL